MISERNNEKRASAQLHHNSMEEDIPGTEFTKFDETSGAVVSKDTKLMCGKHSLAITRINVKY